MEEARPTDGIEPVPEQDAAPRGPTAARALHAILYIPVLLLTGSQAFKCLYVLIHGHAAGVYVIPYGAAFVYLAARARRASRGEIEKPWLDGALLAVAGVLWAFLVYSQFL